MKGHGESNETTITEKSKVPLSIVAAAIMVTASVVWKGSQIQADLGELKKRSEVQWSISDQVNWSLRLANSNPTLRVPEPRESMRQTSGAGAGPVAARE